MTVRVFELRGVYVFQYEGEVPPALERAYNPIEDRYELSDAGALEELPEPYELVEEPDEFRVEFHGDPPDEVLEVALFVEDGPMSTTVLCSAESAVERAVEAGGTQVG